MKKILVVIVILLSFSAASFSQIQIFGKYTDGKEIEPDINVFNYGPKIDSAGKFKITYFALVEKAWAEGLIGVSYSPTKWCELGLMFGLESTPSLYRFSGSIWMGNDHLAFATCLEKGDGADNWWYKSTLSYSPNKKLALGLMSWRYNGTGVFLKYNFTKPGLSLWANPAYDLEFKAKRLTVGLDIKI
jgi:hypothetical protein